MFDRGAENTAFNVIIIRQQKWENERIADAFDDLISKTLLIFYPSDVFDQMLTDFHNSKLFHFR